MNDNKQSSSDSQSNSDSLSVKMQVLSDRQEPDAAEAANIIGLDLEAGNDNIDDNNEAPPGDVEEATCKIFDKCFMHIFARPEAQYLSLYEVGKEIHNYQKLSGICLVIRKSEPYARTYVCGSHVGCCCSKICLGDKIVLKTLPQNSKPYHCGPRLPVTGRKPKK